MWDLPWWAWVAIVLWGGAAGYIILVGLWLYWHADKIGAVVGAVVAAGVEAGARAYFGKEGKR